MRIVVFVCTSFAAASAVSGDSVSVTAAAAGGGVDATVVVCDSQHEVWAEPDEPNQKRLVLLMDVWHPDIPRKQWARMGKA